MGYTRNGVPCAVVDLAGELCALGVTEGDVLLAHVSLRAVGPMEDGPLGLIEALSRSVGSRGTVVMPSWTDAPDRPFDPTRSEVSPNLGVVANSFWRLPDVMRSHTPFAFAARGPDAPSIVSSGLLLPPHQPDSPVGKVLSKNGRVLLLGVDHGSNTMLHLAEWLAGVPYRQRMRLADREYFESRHCFRLFARADAWLDAAGAQVKGTVGRATARLMRARDLIDMVVARLRGDPFSFLHPRNTGCPACEAAWRSIR